jgi:hypothetical protein
MSAIITTLGAEIFRTRNISDIRQQLERKALTCAIIGGSSPAFLPIPIQLRNDLLRGAYHLARLTNGAPTLLELTGEIGDIIKNCYMDGLPAILADSPTPTWGQDDSDLLSMIAEIEALETKAMKGGILL